MVRMSPARTSRAARDDALLLFDHLAGEAHDAEGEGRPQSAILQRMTTQPWSPAGVCAAQGGRRDAAARHHRQSAIHLQCHHRAHSASVSMTTKARGPRSRTPRESMCGTRPCSDPAHDAAPLTSTHAPPRTWARSGACAPRESLLPGSSPARTLRNRHRSRCQRQLRRSNVPRSD
jgi:hypothetical protein